MRDRRRGGRREGRQDHSAHRARREAPSARAARGSSCFPRTAPSAARRWSRTKGASTFAAPIRSARRRSRSGCATSPAATRWTSKGWATSSSINWSRRGLVNSYGDLYRLTLEQLVKPGADGPESRRRICWPASKRASRAGWRGCSTRCRFATSGTRVATVLAEHFGSMDELQAAERRGAVRSQRDRPGHRRERARVSAQRVRPQHDRRPGRAGREDDRAAARRAARPAASPARRSSSPARWKSTAATRSRS